MSRRRMTDEEAWEYYSKPENQRMGEGASFGLRARRG